MKIDFVKLLRSFGVKAFVGLAGWQAWLADFVLNKLWKAIVKAWNQALVVLSTKKEIKDELKKYDEAIHKEGASADDIKKSAPDFLG